PSQGHYGGNAIAWNDPSFTDHAYLNVPTSYKVDRVEGDDLEIPGDKSYGAAGTDTYDTSAPVRSTSTASAGSAIDKGPTSWSEVAGIAASEFASGQVKDALGVFGIPDSPPALQAYREWEQAQAEMRSKAGSAESTETVKTPTNAGQTSASQTPPNLDMPTTINKTVEIAYDPSRGADQWATVVEMALGKLGLPSSHRDRTVQQIDIESGGNPNA